MKQVGRVNANHSGTSEQRNVLAAADSRSQPIVLSGDSWIRKVLVAKPGVVTLAGGIYPLRGDLEIPTGVVLMGSGPGTVIQIAQSATIRPLGKRSGVANLTIESLLAVTATGDRAIEADLTTEGVSVVGVVLTGPLAGVSLAGAMSRIEGCDVLCTGPVGVGHVPVVVGGDSCHVRGCTIESPDGAGGDAIQFSAASVNCLMTGCVHEGSIVDDGTDNVQSANLSK